jgi:hypothetical protein
MFLGICVKYNNINNYSKPFYFKEIDKKSFIAQIIRNIDFSLIINLNDTFELYIINYPKKDSYYIANKKNMQPNNFNILGKYIINFDKINDICILSDFKKGNFKYNLEINYELIIDFSVLITNNMNYIISNPCLQGNMDFFKIHDYIKDK